MPKSISSSSSTSIPNSKTTINDLPQHIFIHILTFLYLPEAIQISLVSRSFRDLWHLLPSLHFDIEEFYSRSRLIHPRSDDSRNLFVEFVSQALMFRQPNPLTKLKLTFEYNALYDPKYNVKSWIRYAINISVSELVIDFRDEFKFDKWKDPAYNFYKSEEFQDERFREFDFYLSDIGKSRIKILKLYKCKPKLPPQTNPIKFISLKSLTIAEVMGIDGKEVSDLVARCVNLEILTLAKIEIFANVGLVFNSSALKELNLIECWNCWDDRLDLDICCPSLQNITIECELGKVINKDTTNLVRACIDFAEESYKERWEKMLSYFTNISSLQAWHELLESNEVPAGCERFASNVKHLEFYCDYTDIDLVGIAALLKLLPNLKTLVLYNGGMTYENLPSDHWKASTVFNMPCLKKLIMRRYQKRKRQEHFIKLFKKNGIVLDKIQLLPPSDQMDYYHY